MAVRGRGRIPENPSASLRVTPEKLISGPIPKAGWPTRGGAVVGARGGGSGGAANHGLVDFALETRIAEEQILHHLPGVVIGGRAEIYSQAQDVLACNAVRD